MQMHGIRLVRFLSQSPRVNRLARPETGQPAYRSNFKRHKNRQVFSTRVTDTLRLFRSRAQDVCLFGRLSYGFFIFRTDIGTMSTSANDKKIAPMKKVATLGKRKKPIDGK